MPRRQPFAKIFPTSSGTSHDQRDIPKMSTINIRRYEAGSSRHPRGAFFFLQSTILSTAVFATLAWTYTVYFHAYPQHPNEFNITVKGVQ